VLRPLAVAVLAALAITVSPIAAAEAPPLSAQSYILVDPATDTVLAQQAPDRALPMASTTKMMTALLAVEGASLDDIVTVPPAALVGGSTAGLVAGERLTVRNLLSGLLVPSGNDAAVTLAVHVGGSEATFVRMMNARARELGLKRTRFVTPHGLDRPGHQSSVRDLVVLAREVMKNDELRRIVRQRTVVIPGPNGVGSRLLETQNDLLARDPDVDGVKTGHTDGAGYAITAHATRGRIGVELYAALIGSPTEAARAADAERLLDWGFAQFGRATLVRDGQVFARAAVRGRPGVTVALRAKGVLSAAIRVDEELTETIVAQPEVIPPIARGKVLGTVTIRAGERVLGKRSLVAAGDVSAPSPTDRLRAIWNQITP
jgi:serine-type D-Ala-D-Ala carboxypeptidase (penicillin-binding protein 5/6)